VNDRSVERSHVDALIVEAQRLLNNYLSKQTERPTLSTICFGLFSGRRNARRKGLRHRR
jgi:hypothetical protein